MNIEKLKNRLEHVKKQKSRINNSADFRDLIKEDKAEHVKDQAELIALNAEIEHLEVKILEHQE